MLEHLGHTCRLARLHAGLRQLDIATTAGTSNATVSRFENATRWPLSPDVDTLVRAYARETDTPSRDLWASAIQRWNEESSC